MKRKILLLLIIWQITLCDSAFAGTSSGANIEYTPATKNMGIGIISPAAKLDVNGQIMMRGGSPASGKILQSDATGLASWVNYAPAAINDADTLDGLDSLQFLRSDTSDNFTSGVLITDAGTRFDVNGDLSIADTDIVLDGANTSFTQSSGNINFTPASGSDWTSSIASAGEFRINTSDLVFNGTNAKVGIGTANPTAKLEVNGTIKGLVINGGTANFTNIVSNNFVTTNPTSFTKLIVTNNVNGATANFTTGNFTNLVVSGIINGSTTSFDGDFTNGSVLFANADGVISQDNNHLYWDRTNKRLAINHFAPDMALDVNGAIVLRNIDDGNLSNPDNGASFIYLSNGAAASNPGDLFAKIKEAGTTKTIKIIDFNNGALTAGNEADLLGGLDSSSYLRSDTSDNYSSGTLTFDAGTTLTMAAGSTLDINSTSVSIADTDITLDGANTSFTQSTGNISLVPASGSNVIGTVASGGEFKINSSDLVFNGTNARVGIGTANPSAKLDVNGTIKGLTVNGSSANFSAYANTGKLISSSVVNGTTANFTTGNFASLTLASVTVTTLNSTTINNSGTSSTAKLISSGLVNGTVANFNKVIASGSVNGDNANFSNIIASGIFNGTTSSFDGDFTDGSILFSNAQGVISEDNAQLHWDRASNKMALGIATPNEKITINGNLALDGSSVPTPSAGFGKLYVNSVNSLLYFQNDQGVSFNLLNGNTPTAPEAGGSNHNFQFNNSGVIGGNGALNFFKGNKTLQVASDAILDINSTNVSIADSNISFDSASGVTFTPTAGQSLNIALSGAGDFTVNTNQIYADSSASKLGIMIGSPNETLTVNGNLSTREVAAPSATGNFGKVYVKSSDSKLYFKDDAGTEFGISTPSPSIAINDLSDAIANSNSVYLGNDSGTNSTGDYNTAIGIEALKANTLGDYNTAMGYRSLYNNSNGYYNSAFGSQSLYSNTNGTANVAAGAHTLYSNTTGSNNTAIGSFTLNGNTTGSNNTALGYTALYKNATANENTALGYQALQSNTTGNGNIAIGNNSLDGNLSGNYNTAIGFETSFSLTSDSYNTALGYQTLHDLMHGTGNTAVGPSAMSSMVNGSYNIALGLNAGKRINASPGDFTSNGIYIGYNTGLYDTGDNNIIIGHNTGNGTITGSSNILIGYNNNLPSSSASNQLDIADTIYGDLANHNVGIGTSSIDTKLEVNGTTMSKTYVNKTCYSNSSAANVTIDWNNGNKQKITLGHNVTFAFTAPSSGVGSFTLILTQDGTGTRTVTWPAAVKWPNATPPTLSTAPGYIDLVSCVYRSANYYCQIGLDFR